MASLLSSHLEQISSCATSIAELPFPGPKRFTNAILAQHDITSLIRDTEAHERALFHLAPPPLPGKAATGVDVTLPSATSTSRRATFYGGARQPKNRAVAAVLGGDLYQRTRQAGVAATRQKGDVDVEILLHGAEKLTAVYPVPGTHEKIAKVRARHRQLTANIAHYEAHVDQQSRDLQQMNRSSGRQSAGEWDEDEHDGAAPFEEDGDADTTITAAPISKADLEREEAEIAELEQKKKTLEERVTDMEKDLGGLMR